MRFAVEGRSARGYPLTFTITPVSGVSFHTPFAISCSLSAYSIDQTTRQSGDERSVIFILDTRFVVCKMFTRLGWLVGRQNPDTLYECRHCGSTFETARRVCSSCESESSARYDFL